ncbi:MAG: DegV family protein [Clostridia bacterium]|nr:DegV family protein [Clostridia bacterium]
MPERKILLSADTPCDIGPTLIDRYSVSLYPLHILLGDRQYTDNLDITAEDIFEHWRKNRELPRTAAINPEEYQSYFAEWLEKGYDILHISLGSGLSSSCQNAQLAAGAFDEGRVYVIDSRSLSTGFGLLVCEAGERIKQGMDIRRIYEEVAALAPLTSASFVLDTLEFMRAGGRCSSIAQLGASVLQLKPSIMVRSELHGGMTVGKKYMGRLDRAMLKYVEDLLQGRDDIVLDRVFITNSGIDDGIREAVEKRVLELQPFREVFHTRASCTISAHCGPNCLGVLFLTRPMG